MTHDTPSPSCGEPRRFKWISQEQANKERELVLAADSSLNPTLWTRLRAAFKTAVVQFKYRDVDPLPNPEEGPELFKRMLKAKR